MRALEIHKLLEECTEVYYPSFLNINTIATPMPFDQADGENALLFISDKLDEGSDGVEIPNMTPPPIAVVASWSKKITTCKYPIIRVKSARSALAHALSRINGIDYKQMNFIGITGTNGKTTTATLIYEILKRCGYKTGFVGTGKIISDDVLLTDSTYSMTTPDPTLLFPSLARMKTDGCEYVVMEVSSHSIALGKIDPIQFEYAIFTNLDNDHLDFHKTKEEYFNTKLKLFSKAKKGLFNVDDEYASRALTLTECDKRSYGIINHADATAIKIELSALNQSTFFFKGKDLIFKARVNLGGSFNVYNSLCALKCVIDLGVKPCIAKEALSRVTGVDGRMEIIEGAVRAIIDYAHTPMAFYNSLKTIKSSVNSEQSLILVFGCGGERDRSKRSEFGKYADLFADKIIITEDNSRAEPFPAIADGIVMGIKSKQYKIIEDRERAIKYAFKIAKQNDVIAVIGKGHERYKIVGKKYIPFDERQIIRDAMKEAGILYASRA